MKNYLTCLFPAMILAGCAEQIEFSESSTMMDVTETTSDVRTRSLDGAVYNDIVGAWMVQEVDPYTLDNFQRAYDNLASQKSTQTLTKAQATEFAIAKKLKPTHYALKIYPRNEKEQWQVEKMEDVRVAYIPFGYSQLTQDELERMGRIVTKSATNIFSEKSPYTIVTSEDDMTSSGYHVGSRTFQLPILYTVWPIEKPLPEDLQYEVDYKVFLPHETSLTARVSSVLETEALSIALGIPASAFASPTFIVKINVKVYDNTLGRNVPMEYIKVRHQIGSYINDTVTDHFGNCELNVTSPHDVSRLTFTYQVNKPPHEWKIVKDGSTIPYSISVNKTINTAFTYPVTLPASDYQVNEIYRAANYGYYYQPVFPGFMTDVHETKIVAHNGIDEQYGSGGYFTSQSQEIHVFNYGRPHGQVIGSTLHEFGHLIHCKNAPDTYYNAPKFLLEAFASYVGWYAGSHYYYWFYPDGEFPKEQNITGQSRQTWWKRSQLTSGGEYTPLFIDLADATNQSQSSLYFNAPNDDIKDVPVSAIWDIVSSSKTWPQCRSKLQSYVGTYYTASEFDNWIADFDFWVDYAF